MLNLLQCEQKFVTPEQRMSQAYTTCTRRRVALHALVVAGVGGAVGALVWKKQRLAGFAAGALAIPVLGFGVLWAVANR